MFDLGHLTSKNDVYSFGVVLLETITERMTLEIKKPGYNIVDWSKPFIKNKTVYRQLIDRKLNGCYRREEAKKVANLAVCYLKERSKSKAKDEGSGAHALTYM
ncbi:non-specific serine/threonine protein kinase [Trifolium repens]|nr:non-specific serine/threonine protein kinase [Trifolium repens]